MSAPSSFKPSVTVSVAPHSPFLDRLAPKAKDTDDDKSIAGNLTPIVVVINAPHEVRDRAWDYINQAFTGECCHLVGGHATLIFMCLNVGHEIEELVSVARAALLLAHTDDPLTLWEQSYDDWMQLSHSLIDFDETTESLNVEIFRQFIRRAVIYLADGRLEKITKDIHYYHMHFSDTRVKNRLSYADSAIGRLRDVDPQHTFMTRDEWKAAVVRVAELYQQAELAMTSLVALSDRYETLDQKAKLIGSEFPPKGDVEFFSLRQTWLDIRTRIIAVRDEMDSIPAAQTDEFHAPLNELFDLCPRAK